MTSRIDDGIYLGGLAVQSHSLSGKAKLRLAKIILVHTVKPDHVVTSIKQSPVLKGHNFLVLS